mgnify:FL=1
MTRILIVEDEDMVSLNMQNKLQLRLGYEWMTRIWTTH